MKHFMMKKLLGIVVLALLWCNVGVAKSTFIVCELKKFFVSENAMVDIVQKPLNKVDPTYLNKETLTFDFEKKVFLGTSMGWNGANMYHLSPNEAYFKEVEEAFIYEVKLNRLTGELKVITRINPEFKSSLFYQILIYDCVKEERKF